VGTLRDLKRMIGSDSESRDLGIVEGYDGGRIVVRLRSGVRRKVYGTMPIGRQVLIEGDKLISEVQALNVREVHI